MHSLLHRTAPPPRFGALLLTLTALLAGCGGGGGGSSTNCIGGGGAACAPTGGTGGGTGGGTTPVTGTQLFLQADTPTIQTDGSAVVTLLATVKDAGNAVVPGAEVNFGVDNDGTLSASKATTNASGVASITLNSNLNKANRTITVTATHGSLAPQTVQVAVQGTQLSFGGDSSAVLGEQVSLTILLRDGANRPIANQPISLRSSLGNPVPATATTGFTGQAELRYTPTVAGSDTVTASALGAGGTRTVVVSPINFSFTAPAADALVNVNDCQPVSVRLSGTAATTVSFTASRGLMYTGSTCAAAGAASQNVVLTTDPSTGALVGTAYVKSPGAGSGTVIASTLAGTVTASRTVKFVATNPTSLFMQGDPSVVSVNGTSTLTAIVRDAAGNPVAGRTVIFTSPFGGGVASPLTVTTTDAGIASTTFQADPSITAQQGVTVRATVDNTSPVLQADTQLTVGGQAIAIALGTNNLIEDEGAVAYRKTYGVIVSDSAGRPVRNQQVTLSIASLGYGKGRFFLNPDTSATPAWIAAVTTTCESEDLNFNNVLDNEDLNHNSVLDAGEDFVLPNGVIDAEDVNGNGRLDPGARVTVRAPSSSSPGAAANVVTDDTGRATFYVEYLRSDASWVRVRLKATATVGGTNNSAQTMFWLPYPASELNNRTVEPSFVVSPFGLASPCSNPD